MAMGAQAVASAVDTRPGSLPPSAMKLAHNVAELGDSLSWVGHWLYESALPQALPIRCLRHGCKDLTAASVPVTLHARIINAACPRFTARYNKTVYTLSHWYSNIGWCRVVSR